MNVRYALRTIAKRRGSTTLLIVTLAVAIAAGGVIYSAIDLVWHLIPARNRDLVYVASTETRVAPAGSGARSVELRTPASVADLVDWQARSTTVDAFAGFATGSANLTGVSVPQRVSTVRVTASLPTLWGLTPMLGRSFRPDEGRVGGDPVVLLSQAFWQQQFSANGAVLGQSVLLDGIAHTVVGVLPPEAGSGLFKTADVFVPLVLDPLRAPRNERIVLVTGRLKPGVTRDQATADLRAIAAQLQREHPDTNQRIDAVVLPLIEASGFNVRVLLALLALIALFVMIVACANVANIIVAQSVADRHEIAVRAALGAGRFDRIKRVLIESTLSSFAAGVFGLVLAKWGIDALRWLAADTFGFAELQMNLRVVAAGVLAAFGAPLGFALLPALRMPAPDPQELSDGTRAVGSHRARRTRYVLVAVQAAAAVVVTLQVGLLVRATWTLSNIPTGFEPAGVLTFRIGLPETRSTDPAGVVRFTDDLLKRLRALPGVASAGIVDRLPIADREATAKLTVEGSSPAPPEQRPTVARAAIAGDYLSTMRIPVKRGREFTSAELADASRVALVNEETVRRFPPGRDPVGARLALDSAAGREEWLQIVGVVGDLRNSDVDQGTLPQVYIPMSSRPSTEMAIVVKSSAGDPLQFVPAIRAQVAQLDRNQPIHDVATMTRVLYDDLAGTYVLVAMLTAAGVIALILSSAGIYGIVSYGVVQRRREIGLRMALGARPGEVVRLMLVQGAAPVATGMLAGLLAGGALALLIGGSVPELDARNPISYAAVIAVIGAATVVASYLPARKAATVDPLATLRAE